MTRFGFEWHMSIVVTMFANFDLNEPQQKRILKDCQWLYLPITHELFEAEQHLCVFLGKHFN